LLIFSKIRDSNYLFWLRKRKTVAVPNSSIIIRALQSNVTFLNNISRHIVYILGGVCVLILFLSGISHLEFNSLNAGLALMAGIKGRKASSISGGSEEYSYAHDFQAAKLRAETIARYLAPNCSLGPMPARTPLTDDFVYWSQRNLDRQREWRKTVFEPIIHWWSMLTTPALPWEWLFPVSCMPLRAYGEQARKTALALDVINEMEGCVPQWFSENRVIIERDKAMFKLRDFTTCFYIFFTSFIRFCNNTDTVKLCFFERRSVFTKVTHNYGSCLFYNWQNLLVIHFTNSNI